MFKRLFGQTELEQMRFLRVRSFVTVFLLVADIVLMLTMVIGGQLGLSYKTGEKFGDIFSYTALVLFAYSFFTWGIPLFKKLLGITSILTLLVGNIFFGIIALPFILIGAATVGLLFSVIGVIWYVILCIKNKRL